MAETLSLCTCSAVHRELYRFYNTVANRQVGWEKKAGGALRGFAFRGRSPHIQRVMKKLGLPMIEDMSCPKFLYRAFRHIDLIKDHASGIDGYWGAYLLVLIDLWIALQKAGLEIPDDIPKVKEGVLPKDPKNISTLCTIIDGLKQVVSISAENYDVWEQARTKFGANIVPEVITGFEAVSKQVNWHKDAQLWSAARNLVHLWYNLEGTYVGELKKLEKVKKENKETYDKDKADKIRSANQLNVLNVVDRIGAIVEKIHTAKRISEDYSVVRNLYEAAKLDLEANEELLKVLETKESF